MSGYIYYVGIEKDGKLISILTENLTLLLAPYAKGKVDIDLNAQKVMYFDTEVEAQAEIESHKHLANGCKAHVRKVKRSEAIEYIGLNGDEYKPPIDSPINPKTDEPYFKSPDKPFNSDWVAQEPINISLN